MANNKNRKLSGVVLTGALVAPAVMSAAQQNVVSADFSSFLSSAEKWGSVIKEGAKSFLNTRAGQITVVVAAVGAIYCLFSLGKKILEYARDKTLEKSNTDINIDKDSNKGQKNLADRAAYEKFIGNLEEARTKTGNLFGITTEKTKDKITITLTKDDKQLEIVANFKNNNFEKIKFTGNEMESSEAEDDFANKVSGNLKKFFEAAEIKVRANTGVSSKEVADVDRIKFDITTISNKKKY